jgi:hypothetical protein
VADSDDDSLAVIAAAVAAAAGLGVGAAAGAEVGTITGAALAPYLERLAVRGEQMFTAHVDRMSRIAADGLGMTADEFAQHAEATNERLLFTVNAFQAATRTVWEAKLQALGTVLRDGLSDDAQLDVMPLVLAALDAIEAPHVRVLRAIRDDPSSHMIAREAAEEFIWSVEDLAKRFPQLSSGIDPIVATLDRHGCIESVSAGGRSRRSITDFGRAMLERIEN